MKVFIVLEYEGDVSRILDVYADLNSAQVRVNRLEHDHEVPGRTFHLLTKSVKELHGLKFNVDGKFRTLIPYGKLRGSK